MDVVMSQHQFPTRQRRQLIGACLIGALATAVACSPAIAQQVVALVNGEPITNFDLEQRSKLIIMSTHKSPTRQEVLDELVNDKLKVREAKRFGLEIGDDEVDATFAGMARRSGGHSPAGRAS